MSSGVEEGAAKWRGPLAGIKVLDLSRVLAGPFATQILGDLGAEILKVESARGGDDTRKFRPMINGESHYFLAINRSKKSIAIDLHTNEGRQVVRELVRGVDILVENFRPGVMGDMGLGYEDLRRDNPGLVYCAISGFGLNGPLRDLPSFDIVTQAMTGALSINGSWGGPPVKLGLPMGDLVGGLFGAIGVLAALQERSVTGKGKLIDVSLYDGLMGLLSYLPQLAFATGQNPKPVGSSHPSLVPYGVYPAADGGIVIACLTEAFWAKLCTAIGRPELSDRADLRTADQRLLRRELVDATITASIRQRTVAEWCEIFRRHDVPHAPVLTMLEALSHPHAIARNMIEHVEHPTAGDIKVVGRPLKFEGHSQGPLTAPPLLGQHTDEILKSELKYSTEQINVLRTQGTIA